jgi:hypothetical protein
MPIFSDKEVEIYHRDGSVLIRGMFDKGAGGAELQGRNGEEESPPFTLSCGSAYLHGLLGLSAWLIPFSVSLGALRVLRGKSSLDLVRRV